MEFRRRRRLLRTLTHAETWALAERGADLLLDGRTHDEMANVIRRLAGPDVIDAGLVIYEYAYIVLPERAQLRKAA